MHYIDTWSETRVLEFVWLGVGWDWKNNSVGVWGMDVIVTDDTWVKNSARQFGVVEDTAYTYTHIHTQHTNTHSHTCTHTIRTHRSKRVLGSLVWWRTWPTHARQLVTSGCCTCFRGMPLSPLIDEGTLVCSGAFGCCVYCSRTPSFP